MYLKFYRPNMRSVKSVLGNYIYASAPIKFNDPFEAMCINDNILRMHKASIPYNPECTIRYKTKRFVACFTKPQTRMQGVGNLLMWAHYAESHKGFCVVYNNIIEDILSNCKHCVCFKPICYNSIFPEKEGGLEGYEITPILTKSNQWKYEREVRFISRKKGKHELGKPPKEVVKAIYLGCRFNTNSKHYKLLTCFAEAHKIPCYQAKISPIAYELDFRLIQKDENNQ